MDITRLQVEKWHRNALAPEPPWSQPKACCGDGVTPIDAPPNNLGRAARASMVQAWRAECTVGPEVKSSWPRSLVSVQMSEAARQNRTNEREAKQKHLSFQLAHQYQINTTADCLNLNFYIKEHSFLKHDHYCTTQSICT